MRPHALFLDFDGLICDTERAAFRSWQELYAWHGLEFGRDLWARMAGNARGEDVAVADLSRRHRAPTASELAWRRARKRLLCNQEPLRAGVVRLLDTAAAYGVPVAVVSSSPRAWVVGHLDRLGIADRVAPVITGDDVAHHKPAPDLYHLALGFARVRPADAVAFEDSGPGVRAAKAARLWCVAVPSSVGSRASVAAADLILDSIADYRLPDPAWQASDLPPGRAVVVSDSYGGRVA